MSGSPPGWRSRVGRAILASALSALVIDLPVSATAICFNATDVPTGSLEVYQQAPPPSNRDQAYPYYPATAFATQNLSKIQSAAAGPEVYYFMWANRSNVGIVDARGRPIVRKANFQPGWQGPAAARTTFTSVAKANACTLAQLDALLGASGVEAQLDAAGMTFERLPRVEQSGRPEARDHCVLPPTPLPTRAAGVMLDYEVQDNRTAAETQAFLTSFAMRLHALGKKAILYTNPLDAPSQVYTGVNTQNAPALARTFDRMTILGWSRNAAGDLGASLDRQIAMVKPAGPDAQSRLILVFELANTSLADAQAARARLIDDKLAGVMLWRDGARQGGECEGEINVKIACLVMGRCQPGNPKPPSP